MIRWMLAVFLSYHVALAAGTPGIVRFNKKIDPGELQQQLIAAGFSINFIECSGTNCTIHMSPTEKKNPLPLVEKYIYLDKAALRKQKMAQAQALHAKWETGTITADEKDQLLKLFVGIMLGK